MTRHRTKYFSFLILFFAPLIGVDFNDVTTLKVQESIATYRTAHHAFCHCTDDVTTLKVQWSIATYRTAHHAFYPSPR